METIELLQILAKGEDSLNQFKKNVTNPDSMAAEIVAFCNGQGGTIYIGVDDDGSVSGLLSVDIQRLNQLISNVASQHIIPAVNPMTQNISIDDKLILVLQIPKGMNKPYHDKNGIFWVKSAADKREATSMEEIQILFQSSGLVHADESPANGLSIIDLDMDYFRNIAG